MERPFRNIEMQTTGVLIDNPMLRFLRNHVGVNTIALSIFSLNNDENQACRNSKLEVDLANFCKAVKLYDFNLRLCINLSAQFDKINAKGLFVYCRALGADQITLRKLYDANDDSPQSKWVKSNQISMRRYEELLEFINNFPVLRRLEYGQIARSVEDMSVVLDDDCMAKNSSEEFKYLIIRPDGKLYGSWDDPASLIF